MYKIQINNPVWLLSATAVLESAYGEYEIVYAISVMRIQKFSARFLCL
jgi:hypothetical protein